jgi:hypothetical protein
MAESKPSTAEPKASGAERRRWRRAPAEWPIQIQLDDGPHQARVRDVSRAGVCFFLDRPLREMTRLKIDLEIPVREGVRRVTGTGAVVRCERISARLAHFEIAVYLQEMAEPDRATIDAYVNG